MRLENGIHLGYCTNIHRGETWEETFDGLRRHTLAVRDRVCPEQPYGIGLRLGHEAAVGLSEAATLEAFQAWLAEENCYVFTINGFPYGRFHGTRVKEQVYSPDWGTKERLDYTNLLFDLLVELLPEGEAGSVSTLPGSFKEFIRADSDLDTICENLRACGRHIEELRQRTGRDLHLGLEPEPLGLFETSAETVAFFNRLLDKAGDREQILRNIGVNYDTCHLAVEFESAKAALGRIRDAGIRISKLHVSSALKLKPNEESIEALDAFEDDIYLHQVVMKEDDESLSRFRDLEPAVGWAKSHPGEWGREWRVHYHVPLHASPDAPFDDTRDHILETLDLLRDEPGFCQHLEMETYTWEVLPEKMRSPSVVDQLEKEYRWTLEEMRKRNLA